MSSVMLNRLNFFFSKNLPILRNYKPQKLGRQLYSTHKGNHRPNTFEKYLLVWHKKYPSVKEVPDLVKDEVMEKVRNKARIKINIAMMVFAAVVCMGMVYSGKQAAKRGESVRKMNEKWHEEQNSKN